MALELLKELHDIRTSIDEIDVFVNEHSSYKKFLEDKKNGLCRRAKIGNYR
jgi:hypothetical protein